MTDKGLGRGGAADYDRRAGAAPGKEALPASAAEVAAHLDDSAAARSSWQRMTLELSQRTGLPLMRGPEATPTVLGAALDAVYYHVTFDEDESRRVSLNPANEAAGTTWPVKIELAPTENLRTWHDLADTVTDNAVRARLRHLPFQVP